MFYLRMEHGDDTFRSPCGTSITNKIVATISSENRNTTNTSLAFTTSTPNTNGRVQRRKSGRRSWFEDSRNTGTKIEIAFETPVKKITESKTEEVETLLLSHFTNPPRVEFGKVRVGKSKNRTISVKNPHDDPQLVRVEKVPHKKKFTVDAKEFTVEPYETVSLVVTWAPEEAGNCREMILFHVDDAYRLQAFVFGTAEPVPKKRKQVCRPINTRSSNMNYRRL